MVLSRSEILSAIERLDRFVMTHDTPDAAMVPGTTFRIERIFREERSPGAIIVYENAEQIAWLNLEDDGTLAGGGKHPDVLIKVARFL